MCELLTAKVHKSHHCFLQRHKRKHTEVGQLCVAALVVCRFVTRHELITPTEPIVDIDFTSQSHVTKSL